ncbi:MAG: hypothetical protein DCC74_05740 [Proteobacteria bacterium]|nr:MAG: hypothetical protein DCC74_05740 [Pseudomonadota bacterium]
MPTQQNPWRFADHGVSVAVRVTPRGGRDAIEGRDRLADGRAVLKVRVRAVAEGGAANAAVIALLARALKVPRGAVRVASGITSRQKQIAVEGDPHQLDAALTRLTAEASDHPQEDSREDSHDRPHH